MSIFQGVISEFPDITVDYFRRQAGISPPLACFLSHVHSDHLAGLDTFNGSFIYCSAATKEILLRLEKSSARLDYAKGILEDPRLQTYKHLEKRLKPIPLDTPTTIPLSPGRSICVTLLDANHCVGSVMFLFEGYGKAVLYTGDTRCEPRLVTAITQNPNMIEYSIGCKTLDRIYLDTSNLDNYSLETKADGLRELLEKLRKYPPDTIFHFRAWTYGYEDVWVALSKALNSKIHVDDYKMRIFKSLVTKSKDNRWATQTHLAREAPALVGFTCGNSLHGGCLTRDENVRVHSCEKGMGCSVMENKPVVWIRPIVTHLKGGRDIMEVGVGGGGEDLTRAMTLAPEDVLETLMLISSGGTLPVELHPLVALIKNMLSSGRDVQLASDLEDWEGGVSFPKLIESLSRKLKLMRNPAKQMDKSEMTANTTILDAPLPNAIDFPYARHSSLPELRDFVSSFKPKDITPCTFDADYWLQKGWSIKGLFGDCCSGDQFEYDQILNSRNHELVQTQARAKAISSPDNEQQNHSHQSKTAGSASQVSSPSTTSTKTIRESHTIGPVLPHSQEPAQSPCEPQPARATSLIAATNGPLHKRSYDDAFRRQEEEREEGVKAGELLPSDTAETPTRDEDDSQHTSSSFPSSCFSDTSDAWAHATRRRAFNTASANITGESSSWQTIGLISTTDHHTTLDPELGHSD